MGGRRAGERRIDDEREKEKKGKRKNKKIKKEETQSEGEEEGASGKGRTGVGVEREEEEGTGIEKERRQTKLSEVERVHARRRTPPFTSIGVCLPEVRQTRDHHLKIANDSQ